VNKIISKLKYDDDEPLYDHVASDEDYATPEQIVAMVIFVFIDVLFTSFLKYHKDLLLTFYFKDDITC